MLYEFFIIFPVTAKQMFTSSFEQYIHSELWILYYASDHSDQTMYSVYRLLHKKLILCTSFRTSDVLISLETDFGF